MSNRRFDFILLYMVEKEIRKRRFYGIVSLFVPGMGQVLSGRVVRGIIQFAFLILFLFVIKKVWNGFNYGFVAYIAGIIFYWLYVAIDAYGYYDRRTAPCEKACPVGLDVSGYIDLAIRGEFQRAKALIYHRSPFIGTLSYICHEPCKRWCSRRKIDMPLEIRAMKRYVFENAREFSFEFKKRFKQKIAVVGAGPSGLSCAYFLSRLGYEVDVMDAKEKPGGALSEFIPEYRLPAQVLESDLKEIFSSGLIDFKGGVVLGKDTSISELKSKYDAVYIATGSWGKRKIGIPGEDKKGVIHALDFLRWIKKGKIQKIYGTIVVIGGGDVAADVARSAMRLSVHRKVVLAYRRSKSEMRIDDLELSEIEEEGIEIMENVVPVEIQGKDTVEGIVFKKTRVENKVIKVLEETVVSDAAYVIVAIGQKVHKISDEIEVFSDGRIVVDENMMTSERGVFAGGDAVRGPSSLVESIRDGREAAKNIHRMLHPVHFAIEGFLYFMPIHEKPKILLGFKKPAGEHINPLRRPYNERVKSFDPVELCFDDEKAIGEGSRCLACPFRYN